MHAEAPRRGRYRLAFAVVALFFLFVLMLLPFAVTSVVADTVDPRSHRAYDLTPAGSRPETRVHVHLDVVNVDEWT